MGIKAEAPLEIAFDDFTPYLHANHAVYMELDGALFYLTDVNDRYWRVQRTDVLNEKGHYTDCSELVPTISEFLDLPFDGEKTIRKDFDRAVFYASEKPEPKPCCCCCK